MEVEYYSIMCQENNSHENREMNNYVLFLPTVKENEKESNGIIKIGNELGD